MGQKVGKVIGVLTTYHVSKGSRNFNFGNFHFDIYDIPEDFIISFTIFLFFGTFFVCENFNIIFHYKFQHFKIYVYNWCGSC